MTRCESMTRLLLVVGLLLGPGACKSEAPSPWKEMKLPVRHAEILPGANERRIKLRYRKTSRHEELFREFGSRLERAGYEKDRPGKGHDPASKTFSYFYKKDGDELLLTVTTAAATDVTVELRRVD